MEARSVPNSVFTPTWNLPSWHRANFLPPSIPYWHHSSMLLVPLLISFVSWQSKQPVGPFILELSFIPVVPAELLRLTHDWTGRCLVILIPTLPFYVLPSSQIHITASPQAQESPPITPSVEATQPLYVLDLQNPPTLASLNPFQETRSRTTSRDHGVHDK